MLDMLGLPVGMAAHYSSFDSFDPGNVGLDTSLLDFGEFTSNFNTDATGLVP